MGCDDPDSRGGVIHQGSGFCAGQKVHSRRSEARRLRLVLQTGYPPRRARGQRQQSSRRRRYAAGAGIWRHAGCAICFQLQRRCVFIPRSHRPVRSGRKRTDSGAISLRRGFMAALLPVERSHPAADRRGRAGLLRAGPGQGASLLPGNRHQPHHRGHRQGREPHAARRWPPAPARPTPHSRSSGGCGSPARKKRILFLADRNILVDQTKTNDFKPFGRR